jgi:hypothetical protein
VRMGHTSATLGKHYWEKLPIYRLVLGMVLLCCCCARQCCV